MKANEVKKSQKANLESQKGMYWLMGVVVAAAFVFLALEWTTSTRQLDPNMLPVHEEPEPLLLITRVPPPPPPPPPPPEMPDVPDVLIETPYETPDRFDFPDENRVVQIQPPPPPPSSAVTPTVDLDKIVYFVDVPPVFGAGDLHQWLSNQMRFPTPALEQGIQGTVFVQFVIERDGSVTDVQVVRSPDLLLTREAERVVRAMPRWTPAKRGMDYVRFRFTLPVHFRLAS